MESIEQREERLAKRRAARLRYKLKNPVRFKAMKSADDARYRAKHKEEKRKRDAEYRKKNLDKIKAQRALKYQKNKAAISAKSKVKYRQDPTAARKRAKRYREEHSEKAKAAVKAWCLANPERIRELGAKRQNRRRARIKGGKTTPYERYDIFLRDKGICYLCTELIDYELRHPDPQSFSIDHVIPIVKGGDDAPHNVASAHLACNQLKHARVLDEVAVLPNIREYMINMKDRIAA